MSGVKPVVGGVGIIASTSSGLFFIGDLQRVSGVITTAEVVMFVLALWAAAYWVIVFKNAPSSLKQVAQHDKKPTRPEYLVREGTQLLGSPVNWVRR